MSARRALPALVLAVGALGLLLAPAVHVPGARGALRLAPGFVPGLWQARFVVARRPAALELPAEPLRVTAALSGPARLRVGVDGGANDGEIGLGEEPREVALSLPSGGRVALDADATIRLHALEVARDGPPPWGRVALVVLAGLLGGALARYGPGAAGVWAGTAVTLAGAALALRGGFSGLLLQALADRFAGVAALAALLAAFALPALLPRGGVASRPRSRLPLLFGAATLVSCAAQIVSAPPPQVLGDPAAYLAIGRDFARELGAARGPDGVADALLQLRPYAGLGLLGTLYGALLGLGAGPEGIRLFHAVAMAGAVALLVRAAARLGGPAVAGLTGALALLYPTFAVICGLIQPEPVILLLWCAALDRLLAAREADDARGLGWVGLLFALGLALHPQGIWFLLAALLLALVPWAARLARRPRRRQLGAFALGLLPVAALVGAGESFAQPLSPVLEQRFGFWAYTANMPLGFWLFLDSDGWQGPFRIDDTRYARALRRAEQSGEVAGGAGRLVFTARFVADNASESLRAVLRNLHRLLHQPDNPPRRDWLLPWAASVPLHRAQVALLLVGVPLLLAGASAPLLAPVAMLCATYPLYHVFNKYAVPAAPFLILGAALVLVRLARERPRALLVALGVAGLGALLAPADLALPGAPPAAARAAVAVLHLGGLAAAWFLAARRWGAGALPRLGAALALLPLLGAPLGASWRDPGWRGFSVALERGPRHELRLPAAARAELDGAREAYLLLDLDDPGDPDRMRLRFDTGLELEGSALRGTMPRFALATQRFGHRPEEIPQWWATPWRPDMADAEGGVAVELHGPAPARLRGELAAGPGAATLSLGEWPRRSVYRLMHDGEYRLPAAPRLEPASQRSFAGGAALPGLLGVRLIVLDDDTGIARWETAPAPAAEVVTAIWARAGRQARAELRLPAGALRLDLEHPGRVAGQAGEVRFASTGEYEGWFLIRTRAEPGEPLRFEVRPYHELSGSEKYFLPELRADPPLPPEWRELPFVPAASVLEARRAPPWRPRTVY